MLLLYLAKWNALQAVTQHQNGQNSTKKTRNLLMLMHTVELSIAVVKVDIKVINAIFYSKWMFTMFNAGLNACWDATTVRSHWTE